MKRDEARNRAVVGLLDIVGEVACRQLVQTPMIRHALAAYSLFVAARVATIAHLKIFFLFALHNKHDLVFTWTHISNHLDVYDNYNINNFGFRNKEEANEILSVVISLTKTARSRQ